MEAVLLAAVTLVGAAGFGMIAREMARLSGIIPSRSVERAGAAFLLLALAQVLSAASYIEGDERIAYALYVGSSSSSVIAYLLLASSTRRKSEDLYVTAPAAALPAALDLAALLGSTFLALRTSGWARLGFSLLSVSHLLRFTSLTLGGAGGLYLLLGGEALRNVASVSLALFYAGGLLRVGKEE